MMASQVGHEEDVCGLSGPGTLCGKTLSGDVGGIGAGE